MQRGRFSDVVAIASRDGSRAREAAHALGLATAHGSYEAMIDDPQVDAIYNPLPNHLHVPWTIRALEAGKHVLCEKPIGLTASEAAELIAVRDRTGTKVQEAFMVRTHPQWVRVQSLVREGRIGELRSMMGYFSYFNRDASNIRNVREFGGGAVMDIGCYLIHTARMIFGSEPRRVDLACGARSGDARRLPGLHHAGLRPGTGDRHVQHAGGVVPARACGRHHGPHRDRDSLQRATRSPCRIFVDDGRTLSGEDRETIEMPIVDQYTVQGDLFSAAVLENGPVAYPLEDSVANMQRDRCRVQIRKTVLGTI